MHFVVIILSVRRFSKRPVSFRFSQRNTFNPTKAKFPADLILLDSVILAAPVFDEQ
jgi:hypothetical protein